MDQKKIGQFIAALRQEKGMTQTVLGERLGVTNKTVSRWENGNYMPDVSLLPQLSRRPFAAQLGISLVLSGGVSNQYDRLRRGSVTDYLQLPHRRIKKRALVWNLADFMLLGGVVLTVLGLLRELIRK